MGPRLREGDGEGVTPDGGGNCSRRPESEKGQASKACRAGAANTARTNSSKSTGVSIR